MAATSKIVDLRNILAARFPHPPSAATALLKSGIAALDQITGGGLPKSAITELIAAQPSAGSASLIHALLESIQHDRYFIALIDGCDSFDPASSGNSALRHLLWIRCRKTVEAIKATDLMLRDGNFPLVIVDLVLNPIEELRKIPQSNWYRLQRLVESISTACLVLSRYSMVSSAQLKIVLENCWTLESLETEDAISRVRFRVHRSHLRSKAAMEGIHAVGAKMV